MARKRRYTARKRNTAFKSLKSIGSKAIKRAANKRFKDRVSRVVGAGKALECMYFHQNMQDIGSTINLPSSSELASTANWKWQTALIGNVAAVNDFVQPLSLRFVQGDTFGEYSNNSVDLVSWTAHWHMSFPDWGAPVTADQFFPMYKVCLIRLKPGVDPSLFANSDYAAFNDGWQVSAFSQGDDGSSWGNWFDTYKEPMELVPHRVFDDRLDNCQYHIIKSTPWKKIKYRRQNVTEEGELSGTTPQLYSGDTYNHTKSFKPEQGFFKIPYSGKKNIGGNGQPLSMPNYYLVFLTNIETASYTPDFSFWTHVRFRDV